MAPATRHDVDRPARRGCGRHRRRRDADAPRRCAGAGSRRFDHVRALFVQTPASLIGYVIGWA